MRPSNPLAIQMDLNNPVFQKQLFNLAKKDQLIVLGSLKKIIKMSWEQVYADRGLNGRLYHPGPVLKGTVCIVSVSERDLGVLPSGKATGCESSPFIRTTIRPITKRDTFEIG